jgi:hypothetical protein
MENINKLNETYIDKMNETYYALEDLSAELYEQAHDDSLDDVNYDTIEYRAYRKVEDAREALKAAWTEFHCIG